MKRFELTRPRVARALQLICAVTCATNLCVAGTRAAGPEDSKSALADQEPQTRYLRVSRGEDQEPTALETAVTRFVGSHGDSSVQVDLIGAVHVGEGSYYDELNKLFKSYDSVLYELVAPAGTRIEPGRRKSGHPVSLLQNVMKDVLDLEFQLDRIDYTAANLVHADMSPKEFSQSMKDRNESFFKMFLRAMGQAMSAQAQHNSTPSDLELLVALVAKDRDYRLKRLMAEQFENMEGQLSAINGPDGSTIITERNKKALQVLRRQLAKGRKRIGIFYGAGHLSDMAERLEKDFGLRHDSQSWLVAWRITPPEQPSQPPQQTGTPAEPIEAAAAAGDQ